MDLPNVFDHADFRRYLKAWFEAKKLANHRFSHRVVGRLLGSSDPSALINVITGRRRIAEERVDAFVEVLGLEDHAATYFRLLVRFGQAERPDERDRVWAEIANLRSRLQAPELDSRQFLYASNRLYPAVKALADCDGFRAEPPFVAAALEVSEPEAADALDTLFRLGFLVRDPTGAVRPAEPVVHTAQQVAELGSYGYHRQNHRLAGEVLDRLWDADGVVQAETAFLGLTLAVPEERLADLRRLLWEAQLRVLHECNTWTGSDRVVQISLQMFPVSRRTTEGRGESG